ILQVPTGTNQYTGDHYGNNPTHYSTAEGDTITDTITGATDAVNTSGDPATNGDTVLVEIKSTTFGNQVVEGTYQEDTITFNWHGEAAGPDKINGTQDDTDICDTTVVAYQTGVNRQGDPEFSNVSNDGKIGFGIVEADTGEHDNSVNGVCAEEPGGFSISG